MDLDESFDGPPEVVFDVVTDSRGLPRRLPAVADDRFTIG